MWTGARLAPLSAPIDCCIACSVRRGVAPSSPSIAPSSIASPRGVIICICTSADASSEERPRSDPRNAATIGGASGKGINDKAFDGRGNYAMGLKEHIVFPEINYDQIDQMWGMDIIVATTAKSDDEARALLKEFQFPFNA